MARHSWQPSSGDPGGQQSRTQAVQPLASAEERTFSLPRSVRQRTCVTSPLNVVPATLAAMAGLSGVIALRRVSLSWEARDTLTVWQATTVSSS
jgi:hypothetical protein